MAEHLRYPSPDDIDNAYSEMETAISRMPDLEAGPGAMNINSYIASLTNFLKSYSYTNDPDREKKMNKQIGVVVYMRDSYSAQTVDDITAILSRGEVKQEVVRFWVEEGLAVNPPEFDAIFTGYPELREELQQARDAAIDRILNKNKE